MSGSYAAGEQCTGILYQRSRVRMRDIQRGTSNVHLVGERYMNPNSYYTGADGADNESMYVGFDNDLYRDSSLSTPKYDKKGVNQNFWGSNHPAGIFMAYVDGSVRLIQYSIDLATFRPAGNRDMKGN